jgi:hypothetical protein
LIPHPIADSISPGFVHFSSWRYYNIKKEKEEMGGWGKKGSWEAGKIGEKVKMGRWGVGMLGSLVMGRMRLERKCS